MVGSMRDESSKGSTKKGRSTSKKSSSQDLFLIKNVSKIYNGRYVLNNVSFQVKAGEILGLIGKSGSGKTTFLNLLVGNVKPDKGEILFRDTRLSYNAGDRGLLDVTRAQKSLKRVYGFASQRPSFYPNLTVMENLLYFGSLYGISKGVLLANAESLLELVDLHSSRHILSKEMSGGMQRRLDIACALIHDPKLLILDEPTSDLDPVLSSAIWDIIRKVNQKGTSVVVVSHNISEMEHLCHRLVVIKNARIASIGSPRELKSAVEFTESIYLHSEPGNYVGLLALLRGSDEFARLICGHEVKGAMLRLDVKEASKLFLKLTSILEKQGEKIIEIGLTEPSLDTVFVSMQESDHHAGSKKVQVKSQ